ERGGTVRRQWSFKRPVLPSGWNPSWEVLHGISETTLTMVLERSDRATKEVRVYTVNFSKPGAAWVCQEIHLQRHRFIIEVSALPGGSRLAWLLGTDSNTPTQEDEVWLSELDGRRLHRLEVIRREGRYEAPEEGKVPGRLQWCPDGSSVSF